MLAVLAHLLSVLPVLPVSCCSVSLPALCCVLQVLPLVLEKALNVVERMAAMAAANPGNAVFDFSDGVLMLRHRRAP